MVTQYKAKATKVTSIFSILAHFTYKARSQEDSGRESKTEQPQCKPGSPPISLKVTERNNRDEYDIYYP